MLACWSALLALSLMVPAQPQPLLVSAAVSLTEALEDIGTAYAAQGRGRVRFNFAGSNVLARQIVRGARADVFVSADQAQMDLVERSGGCLPGSRATIVSNRLALVVNASRSDITDVEHVTDARVRRIAIGDPTAVPAGVYAREYLERVGLWAPVQKKIVPAANVRAALRSVENGSADAGFVYATDVSDDDGVRVVSVIVGPAAPVILYPACVIARTKHPDEARSFLAFLRGPEAQRTFERRGFVAAPR